MSTQGISNSEPEEWDLEASYEKQSSTTNAKL